MKRLAKRELGRFFAALSEKQKVYLPTGEQGKARYAEWQEGMEPAQCLNTVRSAKDMFFPQTEDMMAFKASGRTIEILEARADIGPFVLWGVRACDARSFSILDKAFLAEPADTFYQTRREQATVMTMACGSPEETCFCTALGIDPAEPAGDVSCWDAGDAYLLQANTDRGEQALAGLNMLEDAAAAAADDVKARIGAIAKRLPIGSLPLEKLGGEHMMELFRSERWAGLSESCLGCGTCTFVCPTCQCYDIREFKNGDKVTRFRCWDSCMYSDFTRMSAGQPRPTQMERFRQRFMHKLVYWPSNHEGEFGCVGCGRCLQKCPIQMNIVKVAKALGEEKA